MLPACKPGCFTLQVTPISWHGIHCAQIAETHLLPLTQACHCSLDLLVFIPEFRSTSRWFMVINYTIHGIMYSYYTLKATTEMKSHSPSNHDLPFFPSFLTQKQALKYKKCQSNKRGQRTNFWPLSIMDTCKNHLLKRFEFKIQLIST